jgi:hypothetical protein
MHAREVAKLGRPRDPHLPEGLEIEGHIMQDELFGRAARLPYEAPNPIVRKRTLQVSYWSPRLPHSPRMSPCRRTFR